MCAQPAPSTLDSSVGGARGRSYNMSVVNEATLPWPGPPSESYLKIISF